MSQYSLRNKVKAIFNDVTSRSAAEQFNGSAVSTIWNGNGMVAFTKRLRNGM
ncbi:hypothetical protein KQI74_10450 [Paenibacillus barcinonensis]|uniref:hypothetical protein n=1 Tax=Paenibacillus barcinonensis TaxID=198119 RepID=UPI001C0F51C6|nr:hypothetical protein [Paenibacillus barcinonensis]MBU5352704.1 hypothetical protein [Paenibacillus barcinonensis]